jgi:hypothetical protein
MSTPSTALAVLPSGCTALEQVDSLPELMATLFSGEAPADSLFPQIKMPGAGGIAWEIPTGDPEHPEIARTLKCIVLEFYLWNAWYSKPYDPTKPKQRPDCMAVQKGPSIPMIGLGNPGGPCCTCALNQWGSGVDRDGNPTRGKACQNRQSILVLTEGGFLPYELMLSPTGLRAWEDYAKALVMKGKFPWQVMTEIGLNRMTGSNPYSVPVFRIAHLLPAEESASAKVWRERIAPLCRRKERYAGQDEGNANNSVNGVTYHGAAMAVPTVNGAVATLDPETETDEEDFG